MVLQNPVRSLSILIVSRSMPEGNLLSLGLRESLGQHIKLVDCLDDLQTAMKYFDKTHHDLILIVGWPTEKSEAFVMRTRHQESLRHTGIIVMAHASESFDRIVVENYNAGADEVVPVNLSLTILRSKIVMVFNFKAMTDMLRSANHKLQAMAVSDELTGCANMRGITKRFNAMCQELLQGRKGLAVMMMDLDHFKQVNDRYNHLVGSHVIRTTGLLLQNCGLFGTDDLLGRYGGDEFICLLGGDRKEDAFAKAVSFAERLREHVFTYEDVRLKITASIGVAWVDGGFTGQPADIVKSADAMLYRAKAKGRNQVQAMVLSYPIDFSAIGSDHIVELPGNQIPLKKAG
jgi:diguanylate cyclase (GGDEF)-like protein